METKKKETKRVKRSKGASASIVIIICAIVAHLFFYLVAGAESNFDAKGTPTNAFGTLYHGGFVIPIVITLLLTVVAICVERLIAFSKASGKGSVSKFVLEAQTKIEAGDFKGAEELCDSQQGSVANILKAGLVRYKDATKLTGLTGDQKAAMVEREIEDATALELPYLQQNLTVVAAIASLGTLFGLLGTVLGMIRAFGAMSAEGAPDSVKLSLGISEALMNTAMGIATGALAIIVYNYFATRIESTTNAVNELGFAIGQTLRD